jgi:hypothetical protein
MSAHLLERNINMTSDFCWQWVTFVSYNLGRLLLSFPPSGYAEE